VLENECKELNKRFFVFHTQHRPYIILKWAQTADDKLQVQEMNGCLSVMSTPTVLYINGEVRKLPF
jgi:hypothetical protein